ncbi:MAG: pentapeptide repeat-containing protein, partial [Verrucomicrobiales bacterium]
SYNLSGANLAGVNFSGANLANTNFSNADLSGADLSGALGIDSATFTGATVDGIILPEGYSVSGGYVVGGERPVPWSFVQALLTPLENQVAELSQRPTLAEVQDARVDSIVVAKDPQSGAVTLCFDLQKSDDFISWIAYGGGTLNDLGNGQFKVSLPLGPGKE